MMMSLSQSKYHDVFSGLGHIGNAKIVADKSVTPVNIHHAVIMELENKGTITKAVEPSEWISSTVVVAKPNKIRFVGSKRGCSAPEVPNANLRGPLA